MPGQHDSSVAGSCYVTSSLVYSRPSRESRETVLQFVVRRFKYFDENDWKRRIEERTRVTVNGAFVDPDHILNPHDIVGYRRFNVDEPVIDSSYTTLAEGADWLVVSKSANCPVSEGGRYAANTLVNVVVHARSGAQDVTAAHKTHPIHSVHRLDRETSGVVLLAKSHEAASRIAKVFASTSYEAASGVAAAVAAVPRKRPRDGDHDSADAAIAPPAPETVPPARPHAAIDEAAAFPFVLAAPGARVLKLYAAVVTTDRPIPAPGAATAAATADGEAPPRAALHIPTTSTALAALTPADVTALAGSGDGADAAPQDPRAALLARPFAVTLPIGAAYGTLPAVDAAAYVAAFPTGHKLRSACGAPASADLTQPPASPSAAAPRSAVTLYVPIASLPRAASAAHDARALVVASPLTGRTHQIRVHAEACALPLVGEVLYGATGDVFADTQRYMARVDAQVGAAPPPGKVTAAAAAAVGAAPGDTAAGAGGAVAGAAAPPAEPLPRFQLHAWRVLVCQCAAAGGDGYACAASLARGAIGESFSFAETPEGPAARLRASGVWPATLSRAADSAAAGSPSDHDGVDAPVRQLDASAAAIRHLATAPRVGALFRAVDRPSTDAVASAAEDNAPAEASSDAFAGPADRVCVGGWTPSPPTMGLACALFTAPWPEDFDLVPA